MTVSDAIWYAGSSIVQEAYQRVIDLRGIAWKRGDTELVVELTDMACAMSSAVSLVGGFSSDPKPVVKKLGGGDVHN